MPSSEYGAGTEAYSFCMNKIQKTIAVLLLAAVLLLLVFLPKHIFRLMDREGWLDWLRPKEEPFRGVISILHVAGVRPYLGSLGSWLKKYASKLEKKHYEVYFNVEILDEAKAAERLANGAMPDIISFPAGFLPASALREAGEGFSVPTEAGTFEDSILAVPYAASCRLLVFDPAKLTEEEAKEARGDATKNSIDAFRRGKADCCIADARAVGDFSRLLSAGKMRFFEALPFEAQTDLVQFIGISASADEEKLSYCREFIGQLTSPDAQSELVELGLMPMNPEIELRYEQSFLGEAFELIRAGGSGAVGSAFGGKRQGSE